MHTNMVLLFVLIQELLQPFSYELVGVSGYVSLYYLVPFGIETTALVYLTKTLDNNKVNQAIILCFLCGSVIYLIGFLCGLTYDKTQLLTSLNMNTVESTLGQIENTLGVFTVLLVLTKTVRRN